jgi:hypothetical protein
VTLRKEVLEGNQMPPSGLDRELHAGAGILGESDTLFPADDAARRG